MYTEKLINRATYTEKPINRTYTDELTSRKQCWCKVLTGGLSAIILSGSIAIIVLTYNMYNDHTSPQIRYIDIWDSKDIDVVNWPYNANFTINKDNSFRLSRCLHVDINKREYTLSFDVTVQNTEGIVSLGTHLKGALVNEITRIILLLKCDLNEIMFDVDIVLNRTYTVNSITVKPFDELICENVSPMLLIDKLDAIDAGEYGYITYNTVVNNSEIVNIDMSKHMQLISKIFILNVNITSTVINNNVYVSVGYLHMSKVLHLPVDKLYFSYTVSINKFVTSDVVTIGSNMRSFALKELQPDVKNILIVMNIVYLPEYKN